MNIRDLYLLPPAAAAAAAAIELGKDLGKGREKQSPSGRARAVHPREHHRMAATNVTLVILKRMQLNRFGLMSCLTYELEVGCFAAFLTS